MVRTQAEFHAANGGDAESLTSNGCTYYSNGAWMENCQWGLLVDPPADPRECTKNQIRYWSKLRERAYEDYHSTKQQLLWQCQNAEKTGHPGPSQSDIDRLEKLTATVQKLDNKLTELQDLLESQKPAHLRAQEETIAANRAAAAEARDTIARISP